VIGAKLVDGRPHYLVYGRALTGTTDPQWMIGWVDYDRGLVTEGTVRYASGEVNSVQEYELVAGAGVPVHQYLYIPRFSASLEISYSGFRFISHSRGSKVPLEEAQGAHGDLADQRDESWVTCRPVSRGGPLRSLAP
jgi:hypothetical protein